MTAVEVIAVVFSLLAVAVAAFAFGLLVGTHRCPRTGHTWGLWSLPYSNTDGEWQERFASCCRSRDVRQVR